MNHRIRSPEKCIACLQASEIIVEIDPGIAGLGYNYFLLARLDIDHDKVQLLLVPALYLYAESATVGEPVDPGDIGLRIPLDINPGNGARNIGYAESHTGVGRSRVGITLIECTHTIGVYLVPLGETYRGLVDLEEGDTVAVWRPPVTVKAMHFFLGDKFRQAVGYCVAAVVGKPYLRLVIQVYQEQIAIPDETEITAVG